MNVTLYASFADAKLAQQALGALTDHGGQLSDVTAFFPEGYQVESYREVASTVHYGITTTTGADAAAGAAKGAGLGLGLGAVATLASLFIPGFGLVTGGGALATALAGAAGTAVGGALTGGIAGFLQDQGVHTQIALDSERALKNGSALLIVQCPTGELSEIEVAEILQKYHAGSLGRVERDMEVTRSMVPDESLLVAPRRDLMTRPEPEDGGASDSALAAQPRI